MTINELARECHAIAREKGWYDTNRSLPELLCLVHSELSECLEAARKHDPVSEKIPPHSQVAEELADALIRLFDMAGYLRLDIESAVRAKMEYNRSRTYRHGNKAY